QMQLSPYNPFEYPTHPFGSELTLALSRLPAGLVELALSCRLSTQVIQIVQYVADMMSDLSFCRQDVEQHEVPWGARSPQHLSQPPVEAMFLCITILQHPGRNMVEELLAIS